MFMAESYVGHKLCWEGDLVVNSLWAWATGLGFSRYHGIISTAYSVYRPKPPYAEHWEFFHHLFRSRPYDWEFTVRSKGIWISRLQLTDESFLEMPVLVPPPEEQAQIVRFIRHLDLRVNRLIKAKRRLIELLNEQKQAIIHRAVTRGLDPTVPLKPSGIDWLGNVPEHWNVQRIRTCILDYTAGLWGSEPDESNTADHVVCLRVADFDMNSLSIRLDKLTVRAIPESARTQRLLQKGDILIEKSGGGDAEPVGRVVYFDLDFPAVTSNFVTRIRVDAAVLEPKFLLMVLSFLQATRRNLPSIKQTTGIQNLDERHYFSTYFGIPPIKEQRIILETLEKELCGIRTAIDRVKAEIDLIREYRTRLVADVVTGQLDVRHLDLPEVEESLIEAIDAGEGEDSEEQEESEVDA
jgi:type I restriction enzyme S subunit